MKSWIALFFTFLGGVLLLNSCVNRELKAYHIGVSQCSDDEWRHKMNTEIVREALFYDGLKVDIRSAKDDNQTQISNIL